MGITGLLKDVNEAITKCHIRDFAGQTVGVDGHCWMHKGALDCATELATNQITEDYVVYFMKCVNNLRSYGIEPYVVFDGAACPLKAETNARRKEIRMKQLQLGNECEQRCDMKGAAEHYRQAVTITTEMVAEVCKALDSVCVRYMVASYEADPQLYFLEKTGVVNFILTEDSDLIVFGSKRVLYKWKLFDGSCQLFESANLPLCYPNVPFVFDAFRRACILAGCDYSPSPHGIGLGKAKDIFLRHPQLTITKAIPLIQAKARRPLPTDFVERFQQAEDTFQYYTVKDPKSGLRIPINILPSGKHMMPYSDNKEKVFDDVYAQSTSRQVIILKTNKKVPSAAAGKAPTQGGDEETSTATVVVDNSTTNIDSDKDDSADTSRRTARNCVLLVPASVSSKKCNIEESSTTQFSSNVEKDSKLGNNLKVEPNLKKRKESCLRIGISRSKNKATTPIRVAPCRQVGLRKTRDEKNQSK